ncbi:J domain-containing protein [Salinicola sp. LHM]|uniref:J domain-containing protein n=1 Tax=Salinicola sp. LHM TaxID=3065298 RepID=UPI002ACEA474|nr:J domain-containing protein [Salinicola sp. LHM]WQH34106.1 J domain-containing protein [Salinicola sp. LHM]
MAPARFSAFELLLLKSRYPPDTASLLLLTWVYVNKRVVLAEDQRYLEALANGFRHSHDLETLLTIARTDLTAIQLAAEVVLREHVDEQSHPFLRRAIGLATSEGEPSLRNHHILRFLADLSGATPGDFARLFREVTGRPLKAPDDPSRLAYWHREDNPEAAADQETNRADRDISEADGNNDGKAAAELAPKIRCWRRWWLRSSAARAQRRQLRQERIRLRRQAKSRHQAEARQAQERQRQAREEETRRQEQEREAESRRREQAEREEAYRRERWRQQQQEQKQQEQKQQQQTAGAARPHYRIRLALQVLELDENASPTEIKRAYRRLAQRHHPDRFHGQSELRISLASQRFQRIKNAYDYLMTTL